MSTENSPALTLYLKELEERMVVRIAEQLPVPLDAPDTTSAVDFVLNLDYAAITKVKSTGSLRATYEVSSPVFSRFEEAFQHYGSRLVLLGEPGAGKSITLYRATLQAARDRRNDPSLPVPLFVHLEPSSPQFARLEIDSFYQFHNLKPGEFIALLHQQVTEQVPNLFEGQSVLYLVDGLDELRRCFLYFIQAFLQYLPDAPIVFSYRKADYEFYWEKRFVPEAVLILPLTDEKIEEFLLEKRQQPQLWQRMERDPELKELVRTPLELTMLSAAVGTDPLDLSALHTEGLFAFYIRRRFEQEQTKRAVPFSLEETQQLLSKLAAQMWYRIRSSTYVSYTDRSLPETVAIEVLKEALASFRLTRLQRLPFRVATRIPHRWQSPKRFLSKLEVNSKLEEAALSFLECAKQMRLLQTGLLPETVEFLHPNLREFCAHAGLLEALKDRDWNVRYRAAGRLEAFGSPATVAGLLEALKDKHRRVRSMAAVILGSFGNPVAVPGLLEALKDRVGDVRSSAAEALREIRDPSSIAGLLAALKDRDMSYEAMEALGRIGPPAVAGLLEALQDKDRKVRDNAAKALGEIGDPSAVPGLLEALKDKDKDVRARAANSLGGLRGPAADAGLLEALQDNESDVRSVAANVLGWTYDPATWKRTPDPSFVPEMVEALRDRDEKVRPEIAHVLGKMGHPSAVPALLEALQEKDKEVRSSVAHSLGEIGDPSAVTGLLEALQDSDKDVRRAAAFAMEKMGSLAVPGLLQALKDRDKTVRYEAVTSLGKIGDPVAATGLVETLKDKWLSGYIQDLPWPILAREDSPAVPALLEALKDRDRNVRYSAAYILNHISRYRQLDPSVVTGLQEALKDKDKKVRAQVAYALGSLGDLSALASLQEALKDKDERVRSAAAYALERLPSSAGE